jgi:hypothetical protein
MLRRALAVLVLAFLGGGSASAKDPMADVYELKDKRFVLLGMCPQNGAGDCLSGIGSKTELKPGHASSP